MWSEYQTSSVSKTFIFDLPRVKHYMSKVCTNPLGDPPPLDPTPK